MRAPVAAVWAASLGLLAGAAAAQTNFVPILKAPAPAPMASAPSAVVPVTALRVVLAGSMGQKALLVIDGGAPRALAVGDAWRGVRLLSLDGAEALIEMDGQRSVLRLGAAAVNLGGSASPGSGRVIQLSSDAQGHFLANGQINGRGASFLVDTGATLVSISQAEADRLGLVYKEAPRVALSTANGMVSAYRISLGVVRLGDVDAFNVQAVVQPEAMPHILLGNSFLMRFQMKRENDTLTLEKR